MHSSMIGKVEKAMRYAHEPDRVRFRTLDVTFAGDNSSHRVSLDGDAWHCDCRLFEAAHGCIHTLALQKMLDPMLNDSQRETPLYEHVEPREEVATPV